jgi:hypothetical protein
MTKQPTKPKRAGLDDARNTFAYGVQFIGKMLDV